MRIALFRTFRGEKMALVHPPILHKGLANLHVAQAKKAKRHYRLHKRGGVFLLYAADPKR